MHPDVPDVPNSVAWRVQAPLKCLDFGVVDDVFGSLGNKSKNQGVDGKSHVKRTRSEEWTPGSRFFYIPSVPLDFIVRD